MNQKSLYAILLIPVISSIAVGALRMDSSPREIERREVSRHEDGDRFYNMQNLAIFRSPSAGVAYVNITQACKDVIRASSDGQLPASRKIVKNSGLLYLCVRSLEVDCVYHSYISAEVSKLRYVYCQVCDGGLLIVARNVDESAPSDVSESDIHELCTIASYIVEADCLISRPGNPERSQNRTVSKQQENPPTTPGR